MLFVVAALVIFRLAANIPVTDASLIQQFLQNPTGSQAAQGQLFNLLNLFTGGTIENFSVVMLGLGPYITAVIIMQLLTMIFPKMKQLQQEEGEQGRQKFNQYGRLLTVPLSILQGFGLITLFSRQGLMGAMTSFELATTILVVAAGGLFLMWLGELITEKGIGNGVSLLIFAGIVARLPGAIQQSILQYQQDPGLIDDFIIFGVVALIVIAGVVFITEAHRSVPVSYAKQVHGRQVSGGVSTYLPLKVNQAGVIPIIFALSLLLFPGLVAGFLQSATTPTLTNIAITLQRIFDPTSTVYAISYFILVVAFTYFYTSVTFDPKMVSENLQKQGGFIPGVRPGHETVRFLSKTVARITLAGALFLGVIAVLPTVIQSATGISSLAIGGTAVLIVVSVAIETARQIEAQLTMREYEGY
ncbi:MAG: Protein translocase subunit SecY [Parcubacteria group bacterium GW2011_GWA2_47_8]|nr:MAG: Protein translocase subunit SecY [Parcubacteria group bacterium GW2011_GWA2_47_8]